MERRLRGRRGLYPIVDLGVCEARGVDPVLFGTALMEAVPLFAIQVRAKRASARRAFDVLVALRPVGKAYGVPVFANDRADLAVAAGVDGVHVGQDDLTPADVRQFLEATGRDLAVGLSTHDASQLEAAQTAAIDYVALGPVAATGTKENPDPVVGIEQTRALAVRRARDLPLVVIGGIDVPTAAALADVVDAVAIVSALLPERGLAADLARAVDQAGAFARLFDQALPTST